MSAKRSPRSVRRRLAPSLAAAFAALALLLPLAAAAVGPFREQASPTAKAAGAEFAPGEILVRFRSEAAAKGQERLDTLRAADGGRNVAVALERFGGSDLLGGLRLARVPAEETLRAVEAFSARADVLYAEPNYLRRASAAPNDTRYADQWALKNTAGADINAEAAWDATTGGTSVVVGVVDTGVDIGHRDLKENVFVNTAETPGNNLDDDGNGFADDVSGFDFVGANNPSVFDGATADAHGTHVAGIVGARGNNAAGVAGVNWQVRLLPIKVIGSDGTGKDSDILEGYQYALSMKQRGVNLRVLNNSYSGQGFSQTLRDAVAELNAAGILFVASAGNERMNNDVVPVYPGGYELPNVVSVAATDKIGGPASEFTNRGPQTVHVAAPGSAVLSTTPRGYGGLGLKPEYTEADGSTYSLFSGTSMAAPHVAGAAALASAAAPSVPLAQLRAAVVYNGDEAGGLFNTSNGARRLNASKAVLAALENDQTAPAAAANFRVGAQTGRRVELRWVEPGDDGTAGRASADEVTFTDASTGEQTRLASVLPLASGTERGLFVSLPFGHTSGQITLRAVDNVGNAGPAQSVAVSVAADVADPYTVALEAAAPLTAQNSGTALGLKADDKFLDSVQLPFPFVFYGFATTTVAVSTNGALYVPMPPDFAVPRAHDTTDDGAFPLPENLDRLAMIAGMWSDLRTDRRATDDVYVVSPDRDRVVFRWQAVKFEDETPANFEIELRRDGTIRTRYGSGNQNLQPVVVGISGGALKPYVVPSHTSVAAPLSLTNAQAVTFAPRNPPAPLRSDLEVGMAAAPEPVVSGQNITYSVRVRNHGPSTAEDLVMTNVLPAGTTFVSCTSSHFSSSTCTASGNTVTGRVASLSPFPGDFGVVFTIVAKVTAAPGSVLQNSASAVSFRPDPVASNDSVSLQTSVVAESFLEAVKTVSAGFHHTTSVRNDGSVWTWGAGESGQLGDGNSGIGFMNSTPQQVAGLGGVTQVAEGRGFVLALKSDGTVWAWGSNNQGQLGDGTTTDRTRPVQVSGLSNVVEIAAGSFYAVARKADGTIWTWGANGGIGSNVAVVRTSPVQLNGISNVAGVAAGGGHVLFLKTDKTVWGVGANWVGHLGDGTVTNARPDPVQTIGLSDVIAVAAGGDHSMALKSDGTVWAWGNNGSAQLGTPRDLQPHPTPVQIAGLPAGVKSIASGDEHCMALAADGTVWTWGSNSRFQLGWGVQVGENPTPKQIPNFGGVALIEGGSDHSAALKTDGTLWLWGAGGRGQLGDGLTADRLAPARPTGLLAVSAPTFNPPHDIFNDFNGPVDVTVSCSTPGAVIHFTTNGQDPTEADPTVANGASVRLNSSTILKAKAWKAGSIPSAVTLGIYNISTPVNPIDTTQFFVAQHYRDFLNREPDAPGLAHWTNVIDSCGQNAQCREVTRINVSAAFFLSIEFQQTGYLVERTYKAAYGDAAGTSTFGGAQQIQVPRVRREELVADGQRIGRDVVVNQGEWKAQLEANKQAFVLEFAARQRFADAFPVSVTPAEFVARLDQNAGGVLTASEAAALVQELTAAGNTTSARASVLRKVAEHPVLEAREKNRAFVLMQYFGYLRRNPNEGQDTDYTGYHFWLANLERFNGNFEQAELVKAFISSIEYRQRFGQP